MSERYAVRNQLGHFWGKGKHWVDGTEPKAILHCAHEDEAVNTLFELSSRDIELRGEVLPVALSDRGEPIVEPSKHLLPKPEKPGKADPTDGDDSPAAEQEALSDAVSTDSSAPSDAALET